MTKQSALICVSKNGLHTITTLFLRSYGGYSKGVHLFPFRTEKLSPLWPMVLHIAGE